MKLEHYFSNMMDMITTINIKLDSLRINTDNDIILLRCKYESSSTKS